VRQTLPARGARKGKSQKEVGNEREYLYLSSSKQPLMPTSPVRARKLLDNGKAAVFRMFPFTIILKNCEPQERFSYFGRN